MASPDQTDSAYDALIISWKQRNPWYRRIAARIGLQGKLILCFFALFSAGSGLCCWMFAAQSGEQLIDLMGEQARQLAATLALSSENKVRNNDWAELTHISQDLIKSRNILFVGFLNKDQMPRAMASRDLDFRLSDLAVVGGNTQSLMQVRPKWSPVFGEYLEVVAPILSTPLS